jgi:uncharacterized protein (TIGR02598 family)
MARGALAFSLPEMAMALAILAFAFTGLLGLLPAGLETFRKSMDTSVTSTIAHRLVNEAQQSNFKTYTDPKQATIRHYDAEGQPLDDDAGQLPPENRIRAIYQANVIVNPTPTLPGSATANANLAMVTIQIANNPTQKDLGPAGTPWDPSNTRKLNVPVVTYSTAIAGNPKY